ncbi:uncharacterized protein SPPG_05731 [Spizellomyces punctatus DAOM BR117]|uniref:beta-N-acetylhexosaminidase n=1 Tax=Spizellomyces punctatus (strain DAOM BR117) TaxID=645134 RepID=A0A0L0HAZ3_SPIPD|nr:uncharacterized protein SPPG_05731 [Spizellomyces punctatus DAOM BR117]KNC98750.1 hypothetical protein SPPG_05731 [Spizellomyces punctatus DAOM BR117]|eukprot:XP_016606790.1 hypothetical protein SPPG_05731 [Spizellomyces punctatus DAOM BR117]
MQAFQTRIADIVKKSNRRMLVWDETILQYGLAGTPALPKDAISIAWQTTTQADLERVAIVGPIVVASSSNFYLDCGPQATWCAPFKTWETVYDYDPTGELSAPAKANVIGGEVAMWSETMKCNVLEFAIFPRGAAAAERLCSPPSTARTANTSAHIKYCQGKGIKILISLGGASGAYSLSSPETANKVSQEMWDLFLGGNAPNRPFLDAVLDSVHLDIEGGGA